MSMIGEFYEWLNVQVWIPGPIAFDVYPENPPDPYYSFSPVSDDGAIGEFCETDGGRTVIEFNGYGSDKIALYEAMDGLRKNLPQARNALTVNDVWYIRLTGVTGYQTEDIRIYRYSFQMETIWRVK